MMHKTGLAVLLALAPQAGCITTPLSPKPAAAYAGVSNNLQVRETVAPGVHVLRQPRPVFVGVIGNVTIVEQSDGLVVVDTGNSAGAGRRVVEEIRRISDLPVKAVVITHWHNDHPLGLSEITSQWPDAAVIATQRTFEEMQAGRLGDIPFQVSAEYEARRIAALEDTRQLVLRNAADESLDPDVREQWAQAAADLEQRFDDAQGTHIVLPTTTFTDRFLIEDSLRPIEVRFLGRANTDGDAVAWLPRERILIAGDIVVEPIPYMFNIYPSDQIAVLEEIKALNFRVLIPGHGQVLSDKRYLDQLIGLIREAQRQIAPLAQQGLEVDDVHARLDFSEQRTLFAGDDAWHAEFFTRYATDPLVNSVFREARGEPLGPPPIVQ